MRLKRLEMSGFKSFAQRTVVEFNPGVTAVVGPNGCGKSNIVDALRWAMGEQSPRHLRGQQMEDVIFNGSDSLPATGMAEVSIIFANEDGRSLAEYSTFSEIMVTRRLFRSGESEYAINKVNSRLKDIVELFLGTGVGSKAYSIVEQGKVDELVNSKPEERRALIEEAAGTSKYKSRKILAEKKLERTQQNLLRVADIVREIERQIRSMELQARKAEKYRALRAELKKKISRLQRFSAVFSIRKSRLKTTSSQAQKIAGPRFFRDCMRKKRKVNPFGFRSWTPIKRSAFSKKISTGAAPLSRATSKNANFSARISHNSIKPRASSAPHFCSWKSARPCLPARSKISTKLKTVLFSCRSSRRPFFPTKNANWKNCSWTFALRKPSSNGKRRL